jgi:predicted acylesterase/phospholipase RssA
MADYSLAETFTTFTQCADDRSKWRVYSADPVMIRKLESIGAVLLSQYDDGVGRLYEIRADQMTLKKGKRQLSPESRAALAKRLQDMRAAQAVQGA